MSPGIRERTGYFGQPGSFSHEAALHRFTANELLDFERMSDGFAQLRAGHFDRIVVPFENSIGGAIPDTLDQLILMQDWEKQFEILAQLVMPIRLCLMKRRSVRTIRRLYSHFVPLHVARAWIARHLPGIETIESSSTAAAAERAAADPHGAAIGNVAAGAVHRLEIIASPLVPASTNVTRFLVVGRRDHLPDDAQLARRPHRGMVHLQLPNRPGALADVLALLKLRRINLTQILSRPVQGRVGQYRFLLEMDLPRNRATVARLWPELAHVCASLHLLGIYPVVALR
jgi:chorismate mutase/prephenate dehydratase